MTAPIPAISIGRAGNTNFWNAARDYLRKRQRGVIFCGAIRFA
jgi:hypothetical protein